MKRVEEFLHIANIQTAHVFMQPFSACEWVQMTPDRLSGSAASTLPACLICTQDFIQLHAVIILFFFFNAMNGS